MEVLAKILESSYENIKLCAEKLKNGEIVSFGTETVYGLGANCFNQESVLNIFKYKGRPLSDPLILHVDKIDKIYPLIDETKENIELLNQISSHFWPGAITLILKANSEKISKYITAGSDYVSFRIPNNKVALELLSLVDFPVAAPSANKFCHVSPVSADHVFDDFKEFPITILNCGRCEFRIESTVVKLENKKLVVFRKGAITLEDLSSFTKKNQLLKDFEIEYKSKDKDKENEKNKDKENINENKISDINNKGHNSELNILGEENEDKECPGLFRKHYSPIIPTYLYSNNINGEKCKNLFKFLFDKNTKIGIIDFNEYIKNSLNIESEIIFNLDLVSELYLSDISTINTIITDEVSLAKIALGNIYDCLRNAEKYLNKVDILLLPFIDEILSDQNPYKPTLLDRVLKASSSNLFEYNNK